MASMQPDSITPVLVAVDLQPHSRAAIRSGLALAQEHDLPLVLLHVVHESGESAGFYRHQANANTIAPMHDIAQRMLDEWVAEELAALSPQETPREVRTMVVEGLPGTRIPEVAESLNAALVVLAPGEHHGLSRFWHGSVTATVGHRSQRKLVIIDPVDEAPPGAPNPTQRSAGRSPQ
jgi:nucleotide-binding universal stress UspA family protein